MRKRQNGLADDRPDLKPGSNITWLNAWCLERCSGLFQLDEMSRKLLTTREMPEHHNENKPQMSDNRRANINPTSSILSSGDGRHCELWSR